MAIYLTMHSIHVHSLVPPTLSQPLVFSFGLPMLESVSLPLGRKVTSFDPGMVGGGFAVGIVREPNCGDGEDPQIEIVDEVFVKWGESFYTLLYHGLAVCTADEFRVLSILPIGTVVASNGRELLHSS